MSPIPQLRIYPCQLKSTGLEAGGGVEAGVVDELGDAVAGHVFGWIWAQQGFQELRLKTVGLQPPLIMFGSQDHRHPIMDGGDHGVGLGGDDGEGFDGLGGGWSGVVEGEFIFARWADPFVPEAGHAEVAAVLQGKPERLFASGCGLPFVKAVGGDQAALGRELAAEAGFLVDGVGPGVGELVAEGFIFRPGRDQTPAHGFQNGLSVFPDEDRGLGARGEIVARLKVHDLADEPDEFFQLGQVLGNGVSAAHGGKINLKLET